MTADFAMQNILLQMGLNLVGLEGRRIEKIKTWVLRCHACFKYGNVTFTSPPLSDIFYSRICKDNSKKFCPSCGNPTLLRASVTVAAPGASPDAKPMQVHLKRNLQYKLRGTKYSIPSPKHGSAKTGSGTGLILREDQVEYMRAKKQADGKRSREEQRLLKNILSKELDGKGGSPGSNSWMDPDWIPEMMSVGAGGKGRKMKDSRMDGDMPQIGHGRKNPNERKRKK
jgi:RNA-binding protein NOB1